jgi:uncharacterized protein YxeA
MKKILIVVLVLLFMTSSIFAAKYYIYLSDSRIGSLVSKINDKAEEGWVVSGGITQVIDSPVFSYEGDKLYYYVLMYDSNLIQP